MKTFYIKCIITNFVIMRMFKYNIFYDILKTISHPPFGSVITFLEISCNLIYEKLDDYFCNAKKCKFRRRVFNFFWSSIQLNIIGFSHMLTCPLCETFLQMSQHLCLWHFSFPMVSISHNVDGFKFLIFVGGRLFQCCMC